MAADFHVAPKGEYWRFIGAFFAIIVAVIGLLLYWKVYYEPGERARAAVELAKRLEREQQLFYERQAADTYGGKTPQETLRLYIAAVERGDYELASKYFVLEKQDRELRTLQSSRPEDVKNVIRLLKLTVTSQGSYSLDKDLFSFSRPLTVDFVLYPSAIWKLNDI